MCDGAVTRGLPDSAPGVFDVTGATSLNSTLAVEGATSLASTLTVNGAVSTNSTLQTTGAIGTAGATSVGTTLDVTGATSLNSTLNVEGATSLASTLVATGAATFSGAVSTNSTLQTTGAAGFAGAVSIGTTLDVTGATSLNSTLNVEGATSLVSTLTVTGAVLLAAALSVTGAVSLASTLAVGGALDVTGATSLNSTLAVEGAASCASTLVVTGAATFSGAVSTNSTFQTTGAFGTAAAASIGTTLDVTGATSLNSTLVVEGAATFLAAASVAGAFTSPGIDDDADTEVIQITAAELVGINNATPRATLDVLSTGEAANTAGDGVYDGLITGPSRNMTTAFGQLQVQSNNALAADLGGSISFGARNTTASTVGVALAGIAGRKSNATSANNDGYLTLHTRTDGTGMAERMRIDASGVLLLAKTAAGVATVGFECTAGGVGAFTTGSAVPLTVNRRTDDGNLIELAQADALEGAISVSGTTVTYGTFCGAHLSQLQGGGHPELLRGTVVSSIDEMCEWIADEWTDINGVNHHVLYNGPLVVGTTYTVIETQEDGTRVKTATITHRIVREGNDQLPKFKVSNLPADPAIYGVFDKWDKDGDAQIHALGATTIRVLGLVHVGDLLESAGDGTARVQVDNVIRATTIGKVTSAITAETYADGSRRVPCVLYCG